MINRSLSILALMGGLTASCFAQCYAQSACTGLYDGSASSILRQKPQLEGEQPPTFEATLPGNGATYETCKAFSTSSAAGPASSGVYRVDSNLCGRKYTYVVNEYVRQGVPTSALDGTETRTYTTSDAVQIGATWTSPEGIYGKVTASLQVTSTQTWTTTISINKYKWTATYQPSPDIDSEQPGNRCGDRATGLPGCGDREP